MKFIFFIKENRVPALAQFFLLLSFLMLFFSCSKKSTPDEAAVNPTNEIVDSKETNIKPQEKTPESAAKEEPPSLKKLNELEPGTLGLQEDKINDKKLDGGVKPVKSRDEAKKNDGSEFEKRKEHLEKAEKQRLLSSVKAKTAKGILDELSNGTVAFNAPEKIKYKETFSLHLVLSPEADNKSLREAVREKGRIFLENVKYSKFVEARLEGKGFDISPVTELRQPISKKLNTEWRWEVEPTKTGKQNLYLNLYAVVKIDGETHERLIQTLKKELVIEVTFFDHPILYMKENPGVSFVSFGVLFSLLFFLFRGKRNGFKSDKILKSTLVNVDVFVSYSSKDRDIASRFVDSLKEQNISVWMDVEGIKPATQWSTEIVGAIKSAKLVVLIGSVNSFQSHNVVKEVSLASEQQTPIIPIIIDDSSIPDNLAYQLAGIQVIRADGSDLSEPANKVIELLKSS